MGWWCPVAESEVDALAGLLRGAIGGVGYRGPSTDPAVLARRLIESERVRVDMPGRLTVEQVADLALRCGRAETEAATLEAALRLVREERDGYAATIRGQTRQMQEYVAQVRVLEARLDVQASRLAALGPRQEVGV